MNRQITRVVRLIESFGATESVRRMSSICKDGCGKCAYGAVTALPERCMSPSPVNVWWWSECVSRKPRKHRAEQLSWRWKEPKR